MNIQSCKKFLISCGLISKGILFSVCFAPFLLFAQTNLICDGDFENMAIPLFGCPAFIEDFSDQCWHSTDPDKMLTIWENDCPGIKPFSGNKFVEISTNNITSIYQDIIIKEKSTLIIGIACKGKFGMDTLTISSGPSSGPFTVIGKFASDTNAWKERKFSYTVPSGQTANTRILFSSIFDPDYPYPKTGIFMDKVVITSNDSVINLPIIKIKVQDVLTPNNDGKNDILQPEVLNYKSFTCTVYNRWGQIMHSWNDQDTGWNGNFEGKPVPDGSYYYSIDVIFKDGTKENKGGNVTVMK